MTESKKDAPAPLTKSIDTAESFDMILKNLKQMVERLENEELGLEESIKVFELGMELSRKGQKILDEAERKVELLLEDGSTTAFDA